MQTSHTKYLPAFFLRRALEVEALLLKTLRSVCRDFFHASHCYNKLHQSVYSLKGRTRNKCHIFFASLAAVSTQQFSL